MQVEMTGRRPYQRRLAALNLERSSFEGHWRELSDYIQPRRGRWMSSDRNRGEKRGSRIVNGTATYALRTLTSGMMAGITSPTRPWFRLGVKNRRLKRSGAVKQWLGEVERVMFDVFAASNFYNSMSSVYEELGLFGTAAVLQEFDREDVTRWYPLTVGEHWLANAARGSVDTVYRELPLTVLQTVEKFGLGAVSTTVRSLYDNGSYDAWIPCVHVVEPRLARDPDKRDARNKAWKSVYFETGGDADKLLRESGFGRFPCMAPRWHLGSGDVYGRSPGMDTLADVKQLQAMELEKAKAIAKIVNPPMKGPSSLKGQHATTVPGGITYVDVGAGGQGFEPAYQVQLRIAELSAEVQRVENRINTGFYADLFLMLAMSDRRQITAREIEERHEEKLVMLGPVLERLQDELLDPVIDNTFAEIVEAGILPPPPPELEEEPLNVEYIGLLAQAQKAVGTAGIERTVGFIGQLAAAEPSAMDKIDLDETIDAYAEMQGVPVRIIRAEDRLAELRARRQQEQQAMQAAQAGLAAAQGVKDLAGASMEGDNALKRVADALGRR